MFLPFVPVVPYEVTFYTGDVNKAGTDANVKLTVFGDGGASTEQVRLHICKQKSQ